MRRVKQLVMLACGRGLVDETIIVNMHGIAHLRGSPWTRFLCKDLQYHKQNTKQRKGRENHCLSTRNVWNGQRNDCSKILSMNFCLKAPGRAIVSKRDCFKFRRETLYIRNNTRLLNTDSQSGFETELLMHVFLCIARQKSWPHSGIFDEKC